MESIPEKEFQLIVTVVNKGLSHDVIDAARANGAAGGTILHGRGSGIHEQASFFGVFIEPEKEVIFTLVDKKITEKVLSGIAKSVEIDKPGHGIAFVVDVPNVIGISHLTAKHKDK